MAKKIEVALTLDSRNFDRSITASEQKVDKFTKNTTSGINRVGTAFAALGGAALIKNIVTIGQTFQDLQTSLDFVTGSSEAGAVAFDNLTKLATQTQFGVEELVQTFIRLKGAGIEPTNDLLLTFADTASLAQDQLGVLTSLTELFARGATKGKLELEDFNKIAERGVDVFKPLTKEFGMTIDQIKELAETPEGQEQLFRGIEKALDDTYGGALQEKLKNSSVAFSNLEIAARRLANALFQELGLDSTTAINGLTDAINRLADNGEVLRKVFIGIVTVISFLFNPFQKLGLLIGGVSKLFNGFFRSAGPVAKVLKQMKDNSINFFSVLKSRTKEFFGFGTSAATNSKVLGTLNKTIDEGTGRILAYGSAVTGAVVATKLLNQASEDFVGPPLPPGFVRPNQPDTPDEPEIVAEDTRTALQKYKDMLDEVIPAVTTFEEQLALLNEHFGDPQTVGEIADYDSALRALKDAFNINEELEELIESFEDVESITDYNDKLTQLNGLLNAGKINAKEFEKAKEELDETLGDNESLVDFISTLNSATQTLSDDLAEALMEGKGAMDSFKNFFKTLIKQIIADAIKLLFIIPILEAVGFSVTGGTVTGLSGGGLLGRLGFGQTGIGGGNLMPNRPVLVGESGAELFYPASSGSLIPNNQMGASVTYNINAVDAPSFQALVASDPEFIYNVTRVGAKRLPGAR